ncbi:MAG: hypothetical protein Q7T26_12075 [Dehalococcoidia bacterium]|nr:hypothetical protein [Dehalococcoidia bacterium]
MTPETVVPRTIYCLNPTGVVKKTARPVSARPADLRGKAIGVLWNTKPNADVLMTEMASLVAARYPGARVMMRKKAYVSQSAGKALFDELARECDVVITGSGD